MNRLFWLILAYVVFVKSAWAQSPFEPRLRNYDLQGQIKNQKDSDGERILPATEKLSLASDLVLWKYWPDTSSYYHGPGFWLDTYVEYRPLKGLSLNGKMIFVNGSSSYGYNQASRIKPFIGATWTPTFEDSHWNLMVRFFDLDRTTVGSGLFFQDREMSGALVALGYKNWQMNLRLPGTAVISLAGDVYSMESFFTTGWGDLGMHIFSVEDFARFESSSVPGSALNLSYYDIEAVTSAFLRSSGDGFVYNLEAANVRQQWAGLLGLGYQQKSNCKWCLEMFVQSRHYDQEIVGPLAGSAAFDYIPYNVQFRDYNNAINILGRSGTAQAASVNFNLKVDISQRFFIESLNEVGSIRYNRQDTDRDDFYWYRQSVGFCPYPERPRSCVRFFIANKILETTGIERNFFQSQDIHKRADVFGLEAQILL